jgi:HSP20 family protein
LKEEGRFDFIIIYGSFTRSVRLPTEVQTEKARFENGVLEVRILKTEEAKKKEKKILIK